MIWSKLIYFLAASSLLLVSVISASCTEKMFDTKVNRFLDALFGAKASDSKLTGPFSVKLIVSLKVLTAPSGYSNSAQPVHAIPINFTANQQISSREGRDANSLSSNWGDRLTDEKWTSNGNATTTFLFKNMYKGDVILLSYRALDTHKEAYLDSSRIKSARQISKDTYELSYSDQIYVDIGQISR